MSARLIINILFYCKSCLTFAWFLLHIQCWVVAIYNDSMIASSNGNIFRVTALLCVSPVNSPHERPVTRRFYVLFDLAWTNGWANNRDAGDLRDHRAHYDVTVMACNQMKLDLLHKKLDPGKVSVYLSEESNCVLFLLDRHLHYACCWHLLSILSTACLSWL